MGAYEELTAGRIGEATANLLYQAVADVVRFNRFPAPDGHQRWTSDAVHEVAHNFIVKDGPTRLRKLMLKATDERSLQRLAERSIRNYLSDLARETVKGRLSRAIEHQLKQMDDVSHVGGNGAGSLWMHVGGDLTETNPSTTDLIKMSYELKGLKAARVVSQPQRGRSMIPTESLAIVLRRTLEAAVGPITIGTLIDVVVGRFPLIVEPALVPIDGFDAELEEVPPIEIVEAADRIWAQLVGIERFVLPVIAGSITVRAAAAELGVSKSSVQRAVGRCHTVLKESLEGETERETVTALLLRRASPPNLGTHTGALPSSQGEGGGL